MNETFLSHSFLKDFASTLHLTISKSGPIVITCSSFLSLSITQIVTCRFYFSRFYLSRDDSDAAHVDRAELKRVSPR